MPTNPLQDEQLFTNLITPVNTESRELNIASALADLIDLATEKGMKEEELTNLIMKIRGIEKLMKMMDPAVNMVLRESGD